jgi:hypothetical protein
MKARWINWMQHDNKECTIEVFKKIYTDYQNGIIIVDESKAEPGEIVSKEEKAKKEFEERRQKPEAPQKLSLFEQWAKFTENPKKLDEEDFKSFAQKGLIKELSYDFYVKETGNVRNLTKEEFEDLKERGKIDFSAIWKRGYK